MKKIQYWIEQKLVTGDVIPSNRGFEDARTGELLVSRKMTDEEVIEILDEHTEIVKKDKPEDKKPRSKARKKKAVEEPEGAIKESEEDSEKDEDDEE